MVVMKRSRQADSLGLVAALVVLSCATGAVPRDASAQSTSVQFSPPAQTGATPPASSDAATHASEIRAEITPRNYTTLSSEMAGRIDKINTRPGERFKKGDVLVVLDCITQRALLERARATAVAAERTYAVNQRLYKLGSIGDLELQVSQSEVEKTKADVAVADAAVSKCVITAPFSGMTAEGFSGSTGQKPREFHYVTPGQPVLDILDERDLDIEFIAPSSEIGVFKIGAKFEINIEETHKRYDARITRLAPRVDPVSQSVKVYGEFTGDTHDLLPGMSGKVKLPGPQ
jgi:membrane fusion protein, multidrug efflux system